LPDTGLYGGIQLPSPEWRTGLSAPVALKRGNAKTVTQIHTFVQDRSPCPTECWGFGPAAEYVTNLVG